MPSAASPMTKYMTINGRLPNVTLHEDLLKLPPLVTCRVWGVKEARDKRHKYRNGRNRRKGALSTSGLGCRTDDGRNNKLCNGHGGRNSRVLDWLGAMDGESALAKNPLSFLERSGSCMPVDPGPLVATPALGGATVGGVGGLVFN